MKDCLDLVRVARCMLLARAYSADAAEIADRLYGETPHRKIVAVLVQKAGVDTLGSTGSGAELFSPSAVSAAFSEAARTRSVLGKLDVLQAPFATPLTWITGRTAFSFVEEREPIPVAKPAFATPILLAPKKIAGIIVTSKELLESSDAEGVLEREMVSGALEGLDVALLDPAATETDGRPPSITSETDMLYDGTTATSPAEIDNLLQTMIEHLVALGSNLERAAIITSMQNLAGLALMRDETGDSFAYPNLTMRGGTLAGLPVIATAFGPVDGLTIVDGGELIVADGRQTNITVTHNAMVDQRDNPEAVTPVWVSLFQADALGLKIVREINWTLRNAFVVYATNFAVTAGTASTTA